VGLYFQAPEEVSLQDLLEAESASEAQAAFPGNNIQLLDPDAILVQDQDPGYNVDNDLHNPEGHVQQFDATLQLGLRPGVVANSGPELEESLPPNPHLHQGPFIDLAYERQIREGLQDLFLHIFKRKVTLEILMFCSH
jgi:hypothetical protein